MSMKQLERSTYTVLWFALMGLMLPVSYGAVKCGNGDRCGPPPPLESESQRRTGPRTVVVTPQGQPADTIELVRMRSAGPAVTLGLSYSPGYATSWISSDGVPLLGEGWNLTIPCLAYGGTTEAAPPSFILLYEGTDRIAFAAADDRNTYASKGIPDFFMSRTDGDVCVRRDPWGNIVRIAGFTSRWPLPQRGKPLSFANPFFPRERGVRFVWSQDGVLASITDTADRLWRFSYRAGRLSAVTITTCHGFVLRRVRFVYGNPLVYPGSASALLCAAEYTLEGLPDHWASYAFRYHETGSAEGLLAHVLAPDDESNHTGDAGGRIGAPR